MNIVTLCGSLREGSYNRKLMRIATGMLEAAGATVTEAKFDDVPLYNGDVEDAGPKPTAVARFYDQTKAADAILIVSPEYNYSIPGALKNALDWASRDSNAFKGKVVALAGVSGGQYGTARGQFHLRQTMVSMHAWVIPQPQICVGPADSAFNPDGTLVDESMTKRLHELCTRLIETAQKLR